MALPPGDGQRPHNRSACNRDRDCHAEERSPGVRSARLMRSRWTPSGEHRDKDKADGSPPVLLGAPRRTQPPAQPQEPARHVSCRNFRRCSGAVHRMACSRQCPHGRVLFDDVFAGHSLSRNHWNPYICDNNSQGAMAWEPSVSVASSAIGVKNGLNAAYDLPSAIRVDDGLTLTAYRGTKASGYSSTGSVICSRPTQQLGSGTVHTAGFTFADARVEVRAKMPDLTGGRGRPSGPCLPGTTTARRSTCSRVAFSPTRQTPTNSWRSSCSAAATSSNSWTATLICPPTITLTRWNTGRAAQLSSSLTTRTSLPIRATCQWPLLHHLVQQHRIAAHGRWHTQVGNFSRQST